jgi:hypothetical protein
LAAHYGLCEPGSLRRTLGTRRPSLGPPGGGCPPNCQGWAAHPSGLIQAIDGTVCTETLVRRLCLYGSRGPRPTRGALAPLVACAMPCLALPRTWSRAGRQGRRRPHPAAASTFDCRHRCAGRHRDGWGEQHGWPSWRLYLPDPPKSSCLALAPLVAATGVALGAFARLGFIDYDSDVLRLCNPDAFPPAHRKPGMCRRSPSPCDRWHIRQPVPAARFTAVLPRGSGGDTGGARRNRQGWGHSGRIGVRGVRRPRGWSPGTGGSGLAAGGAGQGRGRPPPATRRHLCPGPLRHGRSGPGLSRTRHAHRPALPERTSSRRARVSVKASSLRSSLREP